MVVQVGDKVLVYGAGTPWSFAKQITTPEVGDKVDVVTLSDGTKLAMPKIELDLSEYVWVVPEFDVPFNIGDVPFQWGMMPLGAAVFVVTDILKCRAVRDALREWDSDALVGFQMVVLKRNGVIYEIIQNTATDYVLRVLGNNNTEYKSVVTPPVISEINPDGPILNLHAYWNATYWVNTLSVTAYKRFNISGTHSIKIKWKLFWNHYSDQRGVRISAFARDSKNNLISSFISVGYGVPGSVRYDSGIGAWVNPDYPQYTISECNISLNPSYDPADATIYIQCLLEYSGYFLNEVWVEYLRLYDINGNEIVDPCVDINVGDKYVIYNPATKRLVFNDATKMLASANWQTGGTGAEIASSPVDYVWDGQGYVYLSGSKQTFSTIQFDDLLYVQAVHGETVRTIPFHLGERISQGGETVSRELTNITSILRAGKNTITLIAKNQDGTKVGFVTSVYVKRNMTAVSL